MDGSSREARINAAFVTVADTLTTHFDVVELLHTLVQECVEILGTSAGGLMLVDDQSHLQLIASTNESADFVEIMQLNADSGPCIEAFHTGAAVSVPDITTQVSAWPEFTAAAAARGFLSVHATPMKLRGEIIGTMNLFSTHTGALTERDARVAQALADVATIGILQERMIRDGHLVAEQLHGALDSRIVIEQAKGVVAHASSLSMDEAFVAMLGYARNRNLTLRSVADAISNKTLDIWTMVPPR